MEPTLKVIIDGNPFRLSDSWQIGSNGGEMAIDIEREYIPPKLIASSSHNLWMSKLCSQEFSKLRLITTMSTPESNADFSSIPILDYSLSSSPTDRSKFLAQLQHALINVGFLYLSNHPVSQVDVDLLVKYIPKLFALPQDAKDKIRMANSEHFLGYSKLGAELTKGAVDQREQFDFATRHVSRWKEGDPDHYRLWGPCQVRISDFCDHFKQTVIH